MFLIICIKVITNKDVVFFKLEKEGMGFDLNGLDIWIRESRFITE